MNPLLQFLVAFESRCNGLSEKEHEEAEKQAIELAKEITPQEVDARDNENSHTALYYAIVLSFPMLVEDLLQKGADVNQQGEDYYYYTPLHLLFVGISDPPPLSLFFQKKQLKIFQLLLNFQPNFELQNDDGTNPLAYFIHEFDPNLLYCQDLKAVFIQYI